MKEPHAAPEPRVADPCSSWFEFDYLPNLTSATVITMLKCLFTVHGVLRKCLTDNARQFTSRELQEFARTWDFEHITSSPLYSQSNGLAERAVRSAKHLLEKCSCDGTDVYTALLNLHNLPRDGLPSPAQHLLSRCTRTLIPMPKSMYLPKVETEVQAALTKLRQERKVHYNKSARMLTPLHQGQTVRMQTASGYDRMVTVLGRVPQHNSCHIQAQGSTYIRNTRHLLQPPESYTRDIREPPPHQ
ncbi:hypothetical protein AAFF_G00010240 [Aldrovandia affinis]|uniref:Integrase catalytic domain-containing protein n=1 Tax=Aldrovandia affinis TaxID=143900 RepID=A0AAD7WHU1_9TELE|nr:hypothetical protein AAFF_G00010240 [Aldrovandia affinis]